MLVAPAPEWALLLDIDEMVVPREFHNARHPLRTEGKKRDHADGNYGDRTRARNRAGFRVRRRVGRRHQFHMLNLRS